MGRIEEIQGVVIEAVFPDELPEINHAITIAKPHRGGGPASAPARGGVLVCEVQQHLGDDRVRAVAMDTTDGLARGMEVIDTGGPITVPVGDGDARAHLQPARRADRPRRRRSRSRSAGRSTATRPTSRT